MDSVYKNMQSSPDQKDHIHYGPYYYPGAEAFPAQMYMNPSRPPVGYGPWRTNYGCSYAPPAVCHGCCNHTYWPNNHAWGSPYSHVPPFHCPGGHSILPVPCMHPPFYAMERPCYEFEKNVPRDHHCCGCPNHPSHQKEQKNVRIEEEETDGERRKNDSLVPFKFENKPCPVMWLPPDFSKNKEHEKPNNIEDPRDSSREVKSNDNRKTGKQQPSFWNGWYPLDLNNLVPSKQIGDAERNQPQKDEGKGHFPFPLFWIPYKPEVKESDEQYKVNNGSAKSREEPKEGPGGEQNFNMNEENVGGQAARRAKDVPVKKVEQHEEKESPKDKVKESDASVKDGISNGEKNLVNGEKELPKDGAERKSPSPPKSPKLPPVCLRVDPLPRKNGANGSSRSPSSPGDKQKVDQRSKEAGKVSSERKPDEIMNSESKPGKSITKIINVADGKAPQEDVHVENPLSCPINSQEDVSRNQTEEKSKEETVPQEHVETDDAAVRGRSEDAETARWKNEEKEVRVDEAKASGKRTLSEEEAAVIIQSAYRGFDVRKWESIKKLKQIAKVREQMAEVKQVIQAMESSSDIQGDSKQRNIVAETIMSLLLKLDIIQGLHPGIREVRKSVVRELVGLQEKLDSLMNKTSQASAGQESIMRPVEDVLKETGDVKSPQDGIGTASDLQKPHQNDLDGGSNCQSMETKEADQIADLPIGKSEEAADSCEAKGTESASEPTIGNVEQKSVEVFENVDTSIAKEDHTDLVWEQNPEVTLLPNYIEEATDLASTDYGKLDNELAELPVGVLDNLYSEGSRNEGVVDADTSKDGLTELQEEGLIEAPITPEFPYDAAEKENIEQVDLPFSGDDVGLEANESLNNCKSDFGAEEERGNKFGGDALYVPDECPVQQAQNVTGNVSEHCEASDERELPILETNDSLMSKEALETPPEEDISRQVPQPYALDQESSPINESANTYEAADMIEVIEAAEDKSGEDRSDSGDQQTQNVIAEPQPQMTEEETTYTHPKMGVLSEQTQESNIVLAKENLEEQSFKDVIRAKENAAKDGMEVTSDGAKYASNSEVDRTLSNAKDELNERNRKMIEENERLRDMMEKLIESGQEQLTAILSLSRRVKDLEKRLATKKKLKMKHYRAPRSGSSCMTTPNGSPKQRTVGVVM